MDELVIDFDPVPLGAREALCDFESVDVTTPPLSIQVAEPTGISCEMSSVAKEKP